MAMEKLMFESVKTRTDGQQIKCYHYKKSKMADGGHICGQTRFGHAQVDTRQV